MTPPYSVEVQCEKVTPGETYPRRNALIPDRLVAHPPNATTLWENFMSGSRKAGARGNFLGSRKIIDGKAGPYEWQTYGQVETRAKDFGSGLRGLGLDTEKTFGLFSVNCAEWTIAELSGYCYSFISVPLYDTLGVEAIEYIVNQTDIVIVVSAANKIKYLLDMKAKLPTLKTIVVIGEIPADVTDQASECQVELIKFSEVETKGKANHVEPVAAKPETVATICYTSGTTGTPKGAVLTHANIMSVVGSIKYLGDKGKFFVPTPNEVHISYLPLAHVLERVAQAAFIHGGAQIGYYQGDTLKLLEDIAELKPTVFVSVPRLFNRVYDKVLAGVKAKGGVAEKLFNVAFNNKKQWLNRKIVNHWFWDRVVFGQIRARLGGRVKHMLSGSAPISPEVMDFLRICFSANVYEGYGQTENATATTISLYGDTSAGHVGAPQTCCEVKLIDVPEMNYTHQDKPFPRGEIAVRGNCVFREYYKLPDKTKEAFQLDKNGEPTDWCRTGDIGMWDDQGRLVIIDRIKNIFKLAQGEYVAPEKIENVYQKHELVAQAFVHGDSLQASLVAVIVPEEEVLMTWAKANNLDGKSFKELCETDTVKSHFVSTLTKFGKLNDLKGFENVKSVYLVNELFTADNGLLTPTFKLKRHEAKNYFRPQIDAMYAEK